MSVDTPRYSRRDMGGWVLITGGAQGVRFIVTLLSAALLARLLRPEDFGLIATVTPLISLAWMLQNLGLSEALVQRPNLEERHISAVFVMSIAISLAVAVILLLGAPLFARVFREPRLVEVVQAMAGVTIVSAAASVPLGLVNRRLRFKQLALIDVASAIGGLAAGVIFALATHTYWALVVMQAAQAAIQLVGAFACAGWRPSPPKFDSEFRSMVGLGAGFSTFNLLNLISRNADMLLISFVHGAGPLGFYERAYKLTMFPLWQAVTPLNRVLVPVLARLQDDPRTYRERYFEATAFMMAAVQPGLVAAIVFSTATVNIILGPGWSNSAPIFFWLGLTGLVQIYAYPVLWLLVSQGRAKECAMMGAAVTGVAVASFLIGVPYGPVGVAMAYAIGDLSLRTPLAWWFAGRRGPVDTAALVWNFIPHAAGMAASAAVLVGLSRVWTFETFPHLVAAATISYLVYAPVLFAFRDKRKLAKAFTQGAMRRLKPRVS